MSQYEETVEPEGIVKHNRHSLWHVVVMDFLMSV